MDKIHEYSILKIKNFPKKIKEGIIYISEEYGVSSHLCPCGCSSEIILRINSFNAEYSWIISYNDNKVTLRPSIFSYTLPCKSHYYIIDNKVTWC